MKLERKIKMLLKLLIILKVKQNNLIKYLKIMKMKNEMKYLIIINKINFNQKLFYDQKYFIINEKY